MYWILATPQGFDLSTDQNNLIFMFDPLSVQPDLSLSSEKKVLRWAVMMCMYNYVCGHIEGKDKVWADLLGRGPDPRAIRRIVSVPPLPSSSSADFE